LPLKVTAAAEATVCAAPASAVGARTGGASTVTVVDTLTSSSGTPLLMVSSKVSVTGAAPFGKAGALNVGCATLALDRVTIGVPPVCRQENVSVRAGELWSWPPPKSVTGEPELTVCGSPALPVAAAAGATTVTAVDAVVVVSPRPTVSAKCSVSGGAPAD